jgi:hypothetical protein
MPKVKCPTLLIHGMKDTLIPFQHSQALHGKCSGPCSIKIPADVDHNEFDVVSDLITPIFQFFQHHHLEGKMQENQFKVPKIYFKIPKSFKLISSSIPWSLTCCSSNSNTASAPRVSGKSVMTENDISPSANLSYISLQDKSIPRSNLILG